MIRRASRAFRPLAEVVERRDLATVGIHAAAVRAATAAHPHAAAKPAHVHKPVVVHPHGPVKPAVVKQVHPVPPKVTSTNLPRIGPGLGKGLLTLSLPTSYSDYGVVTLWNNTRTTLTAQVSASTYNNGNTYSFSFNPGQVRSFYAPVVNGTLPVFQVGFGAGSAVTTLPQDNVVFEALGWVPSATAGWPYAINFGPNGYVISAI